MKLRLAAAGVLLVAACCIDPFFIYGMKCATALCWAQAVRESPWT